MSEIVTGFLTGVERKRCEICGESCTMAMAGSSCPYNDSKCESCGWSGMVCQDCISKKCPACGGEISTIQISDGSIMY